MTRRLGPTTPLDGGGKVKLRLTGLVGLVNETVEPPYEYLVDRLPHGSTRALCHPPGSHHQPSLFSRTMASPSPATPRAPWSEFRQNSPGSRQFPHVPDPALFTVEETAGYWNAVRRAGTTCIACTGPRRSTTSA